MNFNKKTVIFVVLTILLGCVVFGVTYVKTSKKLNSEEAEKKKNEVVIKEPQKLSEEELEKQKQEKEQEEKEREEKRDELRQKAKARAEAEEKARKEAEEKARKEAEEKARKEAEEKARKEAEEKARKEAEEKARKEAEEKARKEAEEKARKEAEEKARKEAEEKARKEAEEKARKEAEEKAQKETVTVKVMNVVDGSTSPRKIVVSELEVKTCKHLLTKCNDIYKAVSADTEFLFPDAGEIIYVELKNNKLVMQFNNEFVMDWRESEIYETTVFDTMTEAFLSLDGVNCVEYKFSKVVPTFISLKQPLVYSESPAQTKYEIVEYNEE